MTPPVVIRDRRTLPFFMVRVRALQEIRNNISGPRRARALGLYALLCQMANEQRDVGEQVRVTATYRELTSRVGASSKTLKVLLLALRDAGAARHEIRVDPLQGSMPSLLHLPTQDGPWVGVTVSMADRLATQKAVALMPALGLLVVLLEFCGEQRETHGGQLAETTRADVARRLGCGVDTLDTWAKALEDTGVLTITRRRGPRGANLPNVWEITEASQRPAADDAETEQGQCAGDTRADVGPHPPGYPNAPGPQTADTLADEEQHPTGDTTTPGPTSDDPMADDRPHRGGESATLAFADRPINERGGDQAEGLTAENGFPPTPSWAGRMGDGGSDDERRSLCQALLAVLEETRGPGPRRRYHADAASWHDAAGRILTDHPMAKVLDAIAYLAADQIIGTKVRTMPNLERHIEDLRHRAHAARQTTPASSPSPDGPTWADAHGQIKRAIRRHGAGGRAAARAELQTQHPAYGRFIDAVGWDALCHDSASRADYEWKQAWKHACSTDDPPTAAEAA